MVTIGGEQSKKAALPWSIAPTLCIFHPGGLPCSLGRPLALKREIEEEKVKIKEESQVVVFYA